MNKPFLKRKMDNKGLAEPLAIIMSIILIFVVFMLGFVLFWAAGGSQDTTKIGSGEFYDSYKEWINIELNQDILLSLLDLGTEYGSLSDLIAGRNQEKIDNEIEKIQNKIKEDTGRNVVIEVSYGDSDIIHSRAMVSFPDVNNGKVTVSIKEKDE
ncbi:MAG: hypothetical protein AABW46_00930 [Nanoarchaeota archaeon]